MITKTEQARQLFINKQYQKSLKIFKTFRIGFTKDELKILSRTYEMFSNERFYVSMGFVFKDQLEQSIKIIKDKYNIE